MSADFLIHFSGSISLFIPLTDAARNWCDEHCPQGPDHQYLGSNLAVEHRYLDNLVANAICDGLTAANQQHLTKRTT